jgi:uncharacterized protein (TIGR02271 family)
MANIISAVFDDRSAAQRAVDALRGSGIPDDAITLVSRRDETTGSDHDRDASAGAGDAGRGAATGAGIGAAAGAAFGLAAALIPGVGPFIAAGGLASLLGATGGAVASGAIVGAASGGIAGALSHWGLNESEARHYAGEVERGGTYLGVDADRARTDRNTIVDLLRREGGRLQDDASGMNAGRDTMAGASQGMQGQEREVRVPLTEERADVRKEARQVGEVAVTKRVDTETQHISEPVTRTNVDVEVRDAPGGAYAGTAAGATNLQPGETIRVPVQEEELIVDKDRQVTGEAVIRSRPETTTEERDIQLRRERVDVDRTGEEMDADMDDADASVNDTVTGRRNY